MAHRHKAVTDRDVCFSRCLRPRGCNPAAHGNINRIEECTCGARRETNLNGRHRESTGWYAQ